MRRLNFEVLTLFPDIIVGSLNESILKRGREKGLLEVTVRNIRDYADDKHKTADDSPYGGGAGMVLKPEPFFEAVAGLDEASRQGPIVLLSARGRRFGHEDAVRLSLEQRLTLLCGHYKDVDQRVAEGLATEELSLGDFVLSGGEPAAIAVIDAVVRLLPGVLGDHESAAGDSHYDGLLSPPSYTRPPMYGGRAVPQVLLSGNHAEIDVWRRDEAERMTRERRPDLWSDYQTKHR